MFALRTSALGAMVVALALLSACSGDMASTSSAPMAFKANLGSVAPVASPGTGSATISYNQASKELTWTLTWSPLSGPATMAHFHGPAASGANAGVALPIAAAGMTSPVSGKATLTDAQAADLLAGRWYVNIHTAANPGGEIRGHVTR